MRQFHPKLSIHALFAKLQQGASPLWLWLKRPWMYVAAAAAVTIAAAAWNWPIDGSKATSRPNVIATVAHVEADHASTTVATVPLEEEIENVELFDLLPTQAVDGAADTSEALLTPISTPCMQAPECSTTTSACSSEMESSTDACQETDEAGDGFGPIEQVSDSQAEACQPSRPSIHVTISPVDVSETISLSNSSSGSSPSAAPQTDILQPIVSTPGVPSRETIAQVPLSSQSTPEPTPRWARYPETDASPLSATASVEQVSVPCLSNASVSHLQVMLEKAVRRAEKGSFFAARSLLVETLREVCRTLDAAERTQRRSQALAAGLKAIEEAEDFYHSGMQYESDLQVDGFIAGHDTPVFKDTQQVVSMTARAAYYNYARQQLAFACGGQPVAAKACFALGRVESCISDLTVTKRKCGPKEIPLYEASLEANPHDPVVAHELGVALAKSGQLQRAAEMLTYCARVAPTAQTLNNLATVYQRLGNDPMTASLQQQATTAPAGITVNAPTVRLVSLEEFQADGAASTATQPVTTRPQMGPPMRRVAPQRVGPAVRPQNATPDASALWRNP